MDDIYDQVCDFAMIGTYSTNFGSAAEIAAMLRSHGLEVEYTKYFFGCATGVAGRRPVRG
jgi:demethylmenaquinone methyltransferase/2-methoxy-6-polyprenyl-1,4-benzoquinol methylase